MFYMYTTLPKMNAMAFIIKPHLLYDWHSFRCLCCYLQMMERRVNILKPSTAGEGGGGGGVVNMGGQHTASSEPFAGV